MPRVVLSPEFAQARSPEERLEFDVEGRTVAELLDEVDRRMGRGLESVLYRDDEGLPSGIAQDVRLVADGAVLDDDPVRLAHPVERELVVSPFKGNAGPMENV